jgi:hypothetical protein
MASLHQPDASLSVSRVAGRAAAEWNQAPASIYTIVAVSVWTFGIWLWPRRGQGCICSFRAGRARPAGTLCTRSGRRVQTICQALDRQQLFVELASPARNIAAGRWRQLRRMRRLVWCDGVAAPLRDLSANGVPPMFKIGGGYLVLTRVQLVRVLVLGQCQTCTLHHTGGKRSCNRNRTRLHAENCADGQRDFTHCNTFQRCGPAITSVWALSQVGGCYSVYARF